MKDEGAYLCDKMLGLPTMSLCLPEVVNEWCRQVVVSGQEADMALVGIRVWTIFNASVQFCNY